MYKVKFNSKSYDLSEHMKSSSLFEALINTGENVFTLTLFPEIFIQLNTKGRLDLSSSHYSPEQIDHFYEALYYFGYNQAIELLDSCVYNIELNSARSEIIDFILKYPNTISQECLLKLNLGEEFFQSYYFDKNCTEPEIYENKFLPNSFFKKNFSKCNIYHLQNRPYITEDFVEELGLFNSSYISDCKYISEHFIERHIDKIEMIDNVSEELARRYISKLNWSRIIFNEKISEAFFTDYYEEFKRRNLIATLCMSRTLPESFFQKHKSDLTSHSCKVYLSTNSNISENFFRRNPELIDLRSIWLNKNISEKFIREHIHTPNWKAISNNPNLSLEFLEEYIKHLYWPDICYNKHIPEPFFQIYLKKLDWESIFANPNISEEFLQQNIHEMTRYYFMKLICCNKVSEEFVTRNIEEILRLYYTTEKYNWYNSNLSLGFYKKYIDLVGTISNLSIYKIMQKCKKYKYNSWKKLNLPDDDSYI
jgi:hypothetical protein